MVQSFKFAIVRLAPEGVRDERINIGTAVFSDDGIDVRLPRRLDKIRVLSAALDQEDVRELTEAMAMRDIDLRNSGINDPDARKKAIGRVGPLTLSHLGTFTCINEKEYELRIQAIFESIIEPEPAPAKIRSKKSRVLTQLKRALRDEKVLARSTEDLASHRVVSNLVLSDGLIADLVLKNGKMHIFETVDASSEEVTARKAITDIAVSAMVLEQARIKFGERETKARLIYEASSSVEHAARTCLDAAAHQGAELINWASTSDRLRLISSITSLATPIESRRDKMKRFVGSGSPRLRLA